MCGCNVQGWVSYIVNKEGEQEKDAASGFVYFIGTRGVMMGQWSKQEAMQHLQVSHRQMDTKIEEKKGKKGANNNVD